MSVSFINSTAKLVILILVTMLFSINSIASTLCDVYLDSSPINRTTSYGEENVVAGNYQALAQQYNAVNGQINSVAFWARVNPASGEANNTIKVVVYQSNQGLPGVILGQKTILIDSASTCTQYIAQFTSPITVTNNIIVSIEPLSPANDNFFVQRNTGGDGGNLNLIKIKQSNQWFKNLAAGDPSYDYDFLILPVKEAAIAASFTSSSIDNAANFVNVSSSNTSSYLWDFGDGDTSTAYSPSHNYPVATANYAVKLKAYGTSISGVCVDSVVSNINIIISGIEQNGGVKKNGLNVTNDSRNSTLYISSSKNELGFIYNTLGMLLETVDLKRNDRVQLSIEKLTNGIYFLSSHTQSAVKFIKSE